MWLPYLIVIGGSLVVAIIELMSTFHRSAGDALRNRWGVALLALNVGASLALYLVTRYVLNAGNDIAAAFVVAATYPTLLKNPLTFVKVSTGREGDFQRSSVELISRLYEVLLDGRQILVDVDLRLHVSPEDLDFALGDADVLHFIGHAAVSRRK